MTYDEAIKSTVTRQEAKNEIQKHNLDFGDFLLEMGDKKEYSGEDVLYWLGY